MTAEIIDDRVKDLVARLDEADGGPDDRNLLLLDLVRTLRRNCAAPAAAARYPIDGPSSTSPYPTTPGGWAAAFDPLEDEEGIVEVWRESGAAVLSKAAAPRLLDATARRPREIVMALSKGACDLHDSASWARLPRDGAGAAIASRGFFELHHDGALADLRQSLRVYLHHVILWGRADLWTSFDRMGVKLAGVPGGEALPLHVDQNPRLHPAFRTIQGVLALVDCPVERGAFVLVPGSKAVFPGYAAFAGRGDYVELPRSSALHDALAPRAQPLALRAGDLAIWDSRTTHANGAACSSEPRLVAYLAAGPAREDLAEAIAARRSSFATGLGANVRDALMHATQKPRWSDDGALRPLRRPERLTSLGRLLYGLDLHARLDP